MKSLTKKALSLAMAMAMAGSFAVSAATIAITDADTSTADVIDVADTGTTTVKVPFTTDITDQLTVLLYKVDTENDLGPTQDNIGYINQVAADDTDIIVTETVDEATVTSFSFPMNDDNLTEDGTAIAPGTYKILVGGTGITEAMTAGVLVVTEDTATLYGDVDGNGTIDAIDASWVLTKVAVSTTELADEVAADVDGNDVIDAIDASWILTKVAVSSTVFPVESAQ